MSYIRVANESDLKVECALRVCPDGRAIALVRTAAGKLYAVDDNCTHEEASLAGGFVEGERIECPRHGAQFDLASGQAVTLPALEALRTYDIRVENGEIFVNIT